MERSDRRTFIGNVVATLNAVFPGAFKTDTKEQKKLFVSICEKILAEYPDSVISAATERIIATFKFPPKIADIVEECKKIIGGENYEALWDEFSIALRRADKLIYRLGTSDRAEAMDSLSRLFKSLSQEIRVYCHSVREFIRIQREDDLTFVKPRFIARIPAIREQIEIEKKYPSLPSLGERLRLEE